MFHICNKRLNVQKFFFNYLQSDDVYTALDNGSDKLVMVLTIVNTFNQSNIVR